MKELSARKKVPGSRGFTRTLIRSRERLVRRMNPKPCNRHSVESPVRLS